MDFVSALERYVTHHKKETDPDIAQKVRPALNCIRFLTLKSGDIAKTSLLTSDEMRNVLIARSSNENTLENMRQMPVGFSVSKVDRGELWRKIQQEKIEAEKRKEHESRIASLKNLYKAGYCHACNLSASRGRPYHYDFHNFYNCPSVSSTRDPELYYIYQKYKHFDLAKYSHEDVQAVYDYVKKHGWIKEENFFMRTIKGIWRMN